MIWLEQNVSIDYLPTTHYSLHSAYSMMIFKNNHLEMHVKTTLSLPNIVSIHKVTLILIASTNIRDIITNKTYPSIKIDRLNDSTLLISAKKSPKDKKPKLKTEIIKWNSKEYCHSAIINAFEYLQKRIPLAFNPKLRLENRQKLMYEPLISRLAKMLNIDNSSMLRPFDTRKVTDDCDLDNFIHSSEL